MSCAYLYQPQEDKFATICSSHRMLPGSMQKARRESSCPAYPNRNLGDRKLEAGAEAAFRKVLEADGAFVQDGHFADEVESQAGALLAGVGALEREELLEDL